MGKVVISVRVPEDVAAAIDKARGSQSRSSWAEQVLTDNLARPSGLIEGSGRKGEPKSLDTPRCPPHPRGRVIKGFCYRCGKPAT